LRRSINVARLRKSEIDFLWIQLEDVIEHGKNKDAKTKLELMERIHQLLIKAMPKNKQRKKR
jgi:2,3-bisphosphoglycerate-independent phosphoglycerate mutase